MALLIRFSIFDQTLPISGNFRYTGQFSGTSVFSVAKLASVWLIQESRTSAEHSFLISNCFVSSISEPNLVLEPIISNNFIK